VNSRQAWCEARSAELRKPWEKSEWRLLWEVILIWTIRPFRVAVIVRPVSNRSCVVTRVGRVDPQPSDGVNLAVWAEIEFTRSKVLESLWSARSIASSRSELSICLHCSGEAEGELSAWSAMLPERRWPWLSWSGPPPTSPQIGFGFLQKPWLWGLLSRGINKRKRGWWPSCSSESCMHTPYLARHCWRKLVGSLPWGIPTIVVYRQTGAQATN